MSLVVRPARADDCAFLLRRRERDDEAARFAWAGVPMAVDGIVAVDAAGPVAGCIVGAGCEPLTAKPLCKLTHYVSSTDEPAALRALAEYAAPADGWVGLTGDHFADAGFMLSQLELVLDLRPGLPACGVRPARPDDLPFILQLGRDSLPYSLLHLDPKDRERVHWDSARYRIEDLLIAEGGFILVTTRGEDALLEELAVHRAFWGRRVAHALVRAACDRLLREGFTQVHACISASNPRSWKVAMRNGFRVTERKWLKRFPSA